MASLDAPSTYQSLNPISARSDAFTEQDFRSPAIRVVDGSYNVGKQNDGSDSDEEAGLDVQGRSLRRERRHRDTSLNGRVVPESLTSKEEKKLADLAVLKRSLVNIGLIALWYTFSVSISLYNEWMFSRDRLDFHFPLFTTSIHQVVQFILASTVLWFLPRFRPQNGVVEESKDGDDPMDKIAGDRTMTPKFYVTRIGPCGTSTALDIGLGNMSMKTISLTFFTMCKSSALAFVLLWAFIFRLESPSVKLCLIILTMTVGVVMMVAGEAAFEITGFVLVILSAFFSGFRWALTQILLLRHPATSNPFSSIFFLTPITFLALILLCIPVGELGGLAEGFQRLTEAHGKFGGVLLMLFPGTIAFCMMTAEYALLKRTSVVTLSICGIFKEILTITASQIAYHDPLTPVNISGLIITIASIAAYNYMKISKMRKDQRQQVQKINEQAAEENLRMLGAENEDDVDDGREADMSHGASGHGNSGPHSSRS